jgi:hypothetical protein
MEHLIWPGVALVLGLFLVAILRKPLGRLIDRVTHIDKTGIRAAAQNATTTKIEQRQLIPSRDLMEVGFTAVIRDQETLLKNYLGNIQFNSSDEREALLLRALARSQVNAQFDRTSMLIYGSQLELLVEASSRPAGISDEELLTKFEQVKAADPVFHEQTTLDSYRGFLLNTGVLLVQGDRLKITPFGKEFLKFLVDNGLTHRRRG